MATFYVKSGAGAIPLANQAWVNGNKMVPTLADATANVNVARRWVWETTTAGTSTGTPTWAASVTQDVTTVTQNGVVWTARKPGFSTGTTANWAYATIYLDYGARAAVTAGDIVYVSNNHAESQSAAYAINFVAARCVMICVNDGAAPPTATALTGALTTTNNSTITIGVGATSGCQVEGIVFTAGSAASGTASIVAANFLYTLKNCQFIIATTGVSSIISMGQNFLVNCDVKFADAAQSVNMNGTTWSGGSLLSGGTSPTALVGASGVYSTMENFDLTNASAGINLTGLTSFVARLSFRNMRLPASWSGALNSGTVTNNSYFEMDAADNAGNVYIDQCKTFGGLLTQETSIYRTGGASNGTTSMSWKLVTITNTTLFPANSLITPQIVKWFPITGFAVASPVTVTLHFIHDNATALNDDEIWSEATYYASSGSPIGTLITNAKSSVLASANAQPSDSSASWIGTGGFSNPNKQKLTLTFTPNLAGIINIVVKMAKSNKTLYLDPQVDFS